jgi:hypothetical protein
MIWDIFNGAFWITITVTITGSIGLAIKYCLKSKCENIDCCWGGLVIHRNVELEQEEEMKAMEMGLNRNDSIQEINKK